MYSSSKRNVTVPLYRKAILVWIALSSSLVFYAVICHVIGNTMKMNAAMGEVSTVLSWTFLFLGLVLMVSSSLVRRRILATKGRTARAGAGENDETRLSHIVGTRYLSALITSLAMSESIGILGVVLFFLGSGFKALYLLLVISAVALYRNRPDPEEIERLYERMERSL